jgi:predicted ATPase
LTLYGEAAPETQLFDYLREKSLLLLLDNFEHLLDGVAVFSALLLHAPQVKILITSREALNLQVEWFYPLKGLNSPLSAYAAALEAYEAVQLFLYHARRIYPDFELAREARAVIRFCEMTAGLPLAIELVIGAGTVKTHTLSIYRKLEVTSRTQAIVRAQALGLLV